MYVLNQQKYKYQIPQRNQEHEAWLNLMRKEYIWLVNMT